MLIMVPANLGCHGKQNGNGDTAAAQLQAISMREQPVEYWA